MSSNIWEVDEEALYKQIFKEFNKTKEDLHRDINVMREWAKTQPHLPEEPSDKLLRCLVLFNKFSIEKAKQKLDMYYTIRSLMPEFYQNLPLSPEMVLQSKVVYCVALPKATPDFKRIIYLQVNPNFGPEYFNHERMHAYFLQLIELIIQDDKCLNCHYIFDCIGVQLGHIPKFSPMVVKKSATILEKVYSNRIASIYLVNFPKFLEPVFNNVIKPMITQKLRDRLTIHSDRTVLLEHFGKSVMPRDIGGEEKSLEELTDCMLKKFEERKARFEDLRNLRVDESLRPQKLVNDDILGYYGNFKALSVD